MKPCPSCGTALSRQSRFCGSCGFAISESQEAGSELDRGGRRGERRKQKKRSAGRRRAAWQDSQRTVLGIGMVYVGALLLLLFLPFGGGGDGAAGGLADEALFAGGVVGLGSLAAFVLGRGAWKASFGEGASPRELGTGAVLGAVLLAVNVLLLVLLSAVIGDASWDGFGVPDAWLLVLIGTAVLPALIEEWLCRGVLWAGLERVTSERGTLVLSSVLFAMLHGLGGAGILELPTRFLAGLVFGLLRARTGSLLPGILAHFVNNAIACFLA